MISFSILTFVLLFIAAIVAVIALVCGAGFVVVFGDLFVCGLIIGLIAKLFRRKKK